MTCSQVPPERASAETGGAHQWVLKRREYSGFAIVNARIPGIPTHSFQLKIYFQRIAQTSCAGTCNVAMCVGWLNDFKLVHTHAPEVCRVAVFAHAQKTQRP